MSDFREMPTRKRIADTISFVASDTPELRLRPYQAADAVIAIVRERMLSDAAIEEGRDILHPMPSPTNLRMRITAALDAALGKDRDDE